MIQLERKHDQTISPEEPATSCSRKDSFLGGDDGGEGKGGSSKNSKTKKGSDGSNNKGSGGRRKALNQFVILESLEESHWNETSSISFGERRSDGAPVAFKSFRRGFSGNRHRREIKALTIAKQARIPFVVDLLAAFEPDDALEWLRTEFVLVMPRLEPLPLDNLELEEIANVMRELCTALKGLHRFGVIHMDIKPTNLMRDPISKQLRLIDFDLSLISCPGTFFTRTSGTKVTKDIRC